ncbi:MAG: TonB-dependent receptor, partial [Deltaproteobacteria bacterium]|nr:TonB-dependent receptor [Deltaproteobacteria bacterium]
LNCTIVLFVCLFVALSFPVYAQEGGDSVTMEEVVVTAGRVKEKKKEITANVTIIGREEIKNSSATDLGDLFAERGIGHIHKYPGASTSVGIRGFRTDTTGVDLAGKVLILLNGRRAGTGNAAKIMTKNIERVEIIRGPASVQYGSAAMGGVVNVITRQGKEKPTAFVEGLLGSYGYKEGSVGFSGKYKAFDFSGSFTRDSGDDYDTGSGARFYNTAYNYKENSSLNLGYEFLPGNRIGVIYTYFDVDHAGNPGYLSQNDLDDYKDSGNKSVDFIYDGKIGNGLFSWELRYFDGKDEDEYFDPVASNPDFWDNGVTDKVTADYRGVQAQFSYNQKYILLTAGFDWVNYETKDSEYSPSNTEYDNPAGFLLAKARLFDQDLIITGGVRYDEYEVDMKSDGGKESDDHTSPRIGVVYLLTDWLKLRANYGEAFRMPTAQQLACDMNMWSVHYVGNPNLKPEKSETYEGGLDFSHASFNVGLTYFHTDFKDKIESYTTSGGDTSYRNLGKAEIDGFEGSISYDIGSPFSWDYQVKPYVSFICLNKYKDKETNEDLEYISDLKVSYGITVSDLDGFSANLNLAYTGKQNITDYEGGTYATITKGSFTVANLAVSKKILDAEKYGSVTLKGEIQNLFDKDYEYAQGYPMQGRIFFLGLRYDF